MGLGVYKKRDALGRGKNASHCIFPFIQPVVFLRTQSLTVTEHQEEATISPSLAASKSADGEVQLSVIGQTNLLYIFEASTNLVLGTKIAVRTNLTGTLEFTPPTSSGPRQFYRVLMP
jgi:hypothetical protein